jgi:hypothetical protein
MMHELGTALHCTALQAYHRSLQPCIEHQHSRVGQIQ